jgi:hypothetical protein
MYLHHPYGEKTKRGRVKRKILQHFLPENGENTVFQRGTHTVTLSPT